MLLIPFFFIWESDDELAHDGVESTTECLASLGEDIPV